MPLHFVFCIHNHQPVGNFGHVLDRAYRECYLPFLEVLERHPRQRLVLHYSGILLDWFEREHPAFLDRLGALAAQGRVEFLGGGYYEPVLALLPEWDRVGQIEAMREFVAKRFGVEVRGLWLAERVWEPDLPRSLAAAGVEYVVLDDHHLKAAGVVEEELTGPFLTGYGGSVVKVIGGSERLRYSIPYQEPERTLDLLRGLYESRPDEAMLVTMADDGEKFGVWPGTHRLIYQERWLDRFFELLERAGEWLCSSTYSEALRAVPAAPPVYIPMVSYREMSEWTLPAEAATRYNRVREAAAVAGEAWQTEPFIRGGHWRGFLAKYPESRYLAGRMRHVSERIQRWRETAAPGTAEAERVEEARRELWRGQCNDAYWHGVFGGLYLPFLRAAVWEHLGKAEETLDRLEAGGGAGLRAESADLDGDGEKEILLGNASLALVMKPPSGAALELSVRGRNRNLFDSLTRRPEAYHQKLAGLSSQVPAAARSIHHLEGTRDGQELRPVVYDRYQRRSLVDHLWAGEYTPAMWKDGIPGGELPGTGYASSRWGADGQGLRLELEGKTASGRAVRKSVSLDAAAAVVSVVLGCGTAGGRLCLGQEFNLTPTSVSETRVEVRDARGDACTVPPEGGEFAGVTEVRLEDPLGRATVRIGATAPFNAWIARLATISNSESGYEEVDQQISLLLWREWPEGGETELDLVFRVE